MEEEEGGGGGADGGGGGGSCVIILKVSQDTGTVSQRLGMKRRRMRKRDGGVSGWWMGVGYRWWWLGRGGGGVSE